MKSVQVLLFATLRESFLRDRPDTLPPSFHLVHVKKKVADAPKGDICYTERKQKSEACVHDMFEQGMLHGTEHYEHWKLAKKKSDMADALCMTEDYLAIRVV
jgi:hypothetical protein